MERACLRPPGLYSQVHTGYILSPLYSLEQEPSAKDCSVHTDAAVKHHQCLQPSHSPSLFDLKVQSISSLRSVITSWVY